MGIKNLNTKELDETSGDELNQYNIIKTLKGIMCTQMPARIGIKKHGEVAIAAMFKELKQLNDGAVTELEHPVIRPIDPKTISEEEKERALSAVNYNIIEIDLIFFTITRRLEPSRAET